MENRLAIDCNVYILPTKFDYDVCRSANVHEALFKLPIGYSVFPLKERQASQSGSLNL
jgi:hypothetical protein